jgi:hypothetical protein
MYSQELADIGASDIIVAGMNANGTSTSVMKAGAAAMKALGMGEVAGRACVDELKALSSAVEEGGDVKEGVGQLGDAVQVGPARSCHRYLSRIMWLNASTLSRMLAAPWELRDD